MATRSNIAIENQDKTVSVIYCHHDGYIDGVGKLLQENYNTREKMEELIALGDISSLGKLLL
jgi:xylose isomerase